jgi:hypothetical protein
VANVKNICQCVSTAILGGDNDPLTTWERWSQFLESGGRFAVAIAAALFTIAIAQALRLGPVKSLARLH